MASAAPVALPSLMASPNTDHSSAAIPHDTADIHDVEADQTEWMVGQVRCSASLGSLVLAFLIF
jgi:hypothetical protein